MGRLKTEGDIYRELRAMLEGRPVPDEVWGLLSRWGFVRQVIAGKMDMNTLFQRCTDLLGMNLGADEANRRKPPKPHTLPGDTRSRALSQIAAIEAARNPDVAAFRNEVLNGQLLTAHQVPAWVEEQAQKDGPATLWRSDHDWYPGGPTVRVVYYTDPDGTWLHEMPVRAGGVLDRLAWLTERLTEEYCWLPEQATAFVLTGEMPTLYDGRAEYKTGSVPEIILHVRPHLSLREVSEFYAAAREKRIGPGRRDPGRIKPHLADLAVFAAQHNDGRPWRDAMELWNKTHPKRSYEDVRWFARDARQAYRRVTGRELVWGQRNDGHDQASGT